MSSSLPQMHRQNSHLEHTSSEDPSIYSYIPNPVICLMKGDVILFQLHILHSKSNLAPAFFICLFLTSYVDPIFSITTLCHLPLSIKCHFLLGLRSILGQAFLVQAFCTSLSSVLSSLHGATRVWNLWSPLRPPFVPQIDQLVITLCTRSSICLTATPTGTMGPLGNSTTSYRRLTLTSQGNSSKI